MARRIGELYASPLYELCLLEGIEEKALEELAIVAKIFDNEKEYIKLLNSPSVNKDEKLKLLDNAFKGKLCDYILNLLKLLCENRRVEALNEIKDEFKVLVDESKGRVNVTVVTAKPLSKETTDNIITKLQARLNKTVKLDIQIDESVLGGMKIKMLGKEIDATVKAKLDSIKERIKDMSI